MSHKRKKQFMVILKEDSTTLVWHFAIPLTVLKESKTEAEIYTFCHTTVFVVKTWYLCYPQGNQTTDIPLGS